MPPFGPRYPTKQVFENKDTEHKGTLKRHTKIALQQKAKRVSNRSELPRRHGHTHTHAHLHTHTHTHTHTHHHHHHQQQQPHARQFSGRTTQARTHTDITTKPH